MLLACEIPSKLLEDQKKTPPKNQTQLNLNYLVEAYPRFLLFLSFSVAHFSASLAIPP